MTPQELAQAIEHIERWEEGGIPAAIARLEKMATDSEAWAARSPHKGGKRKAVALADAAQHRAHAAALRAAAGLGR